MTRLRMWPGNVINVVGAQVKRRRTGGNRDGWARTKADGGNNGGRGRTKADEEKWGQTRGNKG